jgi:probable rRNA maturation factor
MTKVTLQLATTAAQIPKKTSLNQWVKSTLNEVKQQGDLTLRIVDKEESAQLNQTFRHKSGPTNVLSFPYERLPISMEDEEDTFLGDIVICAPRVVEEAKAQNKTETAHWAHLIVHGVLHLLGYDHINDKDAMIMENLEIKILKQLGFENPYE